MRLIGRRCKHGDVFSLPVLIGRGLDLPLTLLGFASLTLLFVQFSGFDHNLDNTEAGAYGYEVPPVPFPNTEVKLFRVDDTWTVTSWKIISMPALFN